MWRIPWLCRKEVLAVEFGRNGRSILSDCPKWLHNPEAGEAQSLHSVENLIPIYQAMMTEALRTFVHQTLLSERQGAREQLGHAFDWLPLLRYRKVPVSSPTQA